MFLYILLTIIVSLIFLAYQSRYRDYWKKRNVIQISDIMWTYILGKKSLPECFKDVYDQYDEPVGTTIGSQRAVVLKDLRDVQAVMATEFQSFYKRSILNNPNDILADNVLFMEDYKRWKCVRTRLTPVFTTSKLKNMFYIMDKCGRDFVDTIDKDINETNENSFDTVFKYTTASIAAAVFGIDTKFQNTMDSPLSKMAITLLTPSFKTSFIFAFGSLFPDLLLLLNHKFFGEHEDFFVGVVKDIMNKRREENIKRHDFIDTCIELQSQGTMHDVTTGFKLEPTYEVLAAQAFFFFIAGADTTAKTMQFTLLELAANKHVLKKLHAEIDSVFATGVNELSYNDVEKLQYLDMVISESMRKYPTIGILQRKCIKNTVLPGSKILIEKDVVVVAPVYAIHRDEKYFPEPDEFIPERFAPDKIGEIKKFSFMPFGEGNRICIGSRFARLQLKAGLAWLLKKYTLEEQLYKPKHFEKSSFSLRDTKTNFKLIPRTV